MASSIKKGLQASYDAITTKDSGTLYLITDAPKIYLGDILLANISGAESGKTLESVAFDSDAYILTFTYTDTSTQVVDLPVESVIQSVSYDGDTHKLTISLVNGTTSDIDLTDLVNAYTVIDSQTVGMTLTSGEIKADVKISADAGNQLTVNADGLFVPEADQSIGTF